MIFHVRLTKGEEKTERSLVINIIELFKTNIVFIRTVIRDSCDILLIYWYDTLTCNQFQFIYRNKGV